MRFAYADPPYPGQAKKHYSHDPLCAEVDHKALIDEMCAHYDGWALSTNSTSLQNILTLCPEDVRLGAWVKPFASFKPNVNPAYTWEPVILWHGRKMGRERLTVKDHVIESITLRRGLSGVKPMKFCFWLFDFAGLHHEDTFHDLFPGSGSVTVAWQIWQDRESKAPLRVGLFAHE